MRRPEWTVIVEPCDPTALDAIADLSDDQLDALIAGIPADLPPDSTGRGDTDRLPLSITDWRHHGATPSLPASHSTPCG